MRRHAEGGLVDAGASSGGNWVALVDVVVAFPSNERVGRRGREQTARPDEKQQQGRIFYNEAVATEWMVGVCEHEGWERGTLRKSTEGG